MLLLILALTLDSPTSTLTLTLTLGHGHGHGPISGEFLEFVRAGGYSEEKHWTEDGWNWRTFRNAKVGQDN